MTKTSLEENIRDERTVAVTAQESLDGIREKAMRTTSTDELGASSSAGRWSSSGGAVNDKNKKVNEIVRAMVGFMTKEEDIVVASERRDFEASNTKPEHEISRGCDESRISVEGVHQQ